MTAGGDKPGSISIGGIVLGAMLVFGEILGIAGFYNAVSGGELIFLQAIVSAVLIVVPVLAFIVIRSRRTRTPKK